MTFAATALAGSFTSDFSNPNQTGFTLLGSGTRPDGNPFEPVIQDGHLVLMWNENGETGSIFFDDLDGGAAIESFTATFKLQIGPGTANAADGLSFVFGPDIDTSVVFGEEGIGNGLIVSFDIYDNGGGEAPAIDVKYAGATVATTKFAQSELVTSAFEDVEIKLNRNGTINVSHKGNIIYTNLVIPGFAPTNGTFAMGARTGSLNADHWIDDLSITTTRASAGAPSITAQPASQTTAEGAPVTFTVGYDGSSPLTLQWLSNNVAITGATNPVYTIARAPFSASGALYKCAVSNASGSATSQPATLTVTADTTSPTLMYVTGSKTFKGARVWFSEPLDPSSAQNAANYKIEGLTVSSATLVAPAGSTGDNMVDLVTSAQTSGQTYTLTVSGVKDAAAAGNTVAASTLQFTAWTLSQGYLLFEHWDGITGNTDADIDTALADPRVVANNPTTLGYVSGQFSTRSVFPNDSHENYFARITGWITPTESGDYDFFVASDDASRLYLSTTNTLPNPATDTPICTRAGAGATLHEPSDGDPSTTVAPIPLVAGKQYGVMALYKEGTGGDYMMVAWRKTTDTTPVGNLPFVQGQFLSTYVDPNVELAVTKQPTDQTGVMPSTGIEMLSEDFNANNGGYTVVDTDPAPQGPWVYDSTTGKWVADGGMDGCTTPSNSQLNSPAYKLTQDGALSLSFSHRYSFESGLYDGGQVRISVNGGAFTAVPATNFTANGYAIGNIVGNGILLGQRAFNDDSPGFTTGEFITSKASLGTFSKNDTIIVQFLGAWDECSANKRPSWTIDSLKLELLPMIIQDFAKTYGGFTVTNTATPPPGPWVYIATNGVWAADGGADGCTGPYNSTLNSPAYVVPQSDQVTLSFTHRYSFEADYWDGGQVRISVNGGAFTPVPAENFTANGYAAGNIQGTGVLNGQRAFNANSPGYATTNFITSSVLLGTFNKNDTIVVQFVGAWDECSVASRPGWVIKSLQLVFGTAPQSATFEAQVSALRQGAPIPITQQWQRDDGAGFVDIIGANSSTFRIFPVAADFNAHFRLMASVPGKIVTSTPVKLVLGSIEPPTVAISTAAGVTTIHFTGALQSAATIAGPFQNVTGATSPYTVPAAAGIAFFRSVK